MKNFCNFIFKRGENMAKEELHHCPKCGGAPKVRYSKPFTWIECKKCGYTTTKIPDYDRERDPESRAMVVEEWNGRLL